MIVRRNGPPPIYRFTMPRPYVFATNLSAARHDPRSGQGVTMSSADIFSPFTLGPLTLPNRIVMAPMTRNRAGAGNAPVALNATY
jgi:hypothetical protein